MDKSKTHPNNLHQKVSDDIGARQGGALQQPQTDDADDLVKTMTDERHPNVPDTANADHGPRGAMPGGKKPPLNNETLKDAYSADDEK